MKETLVVLYKRMADFTSEECKRKGCKLDKYGQNRCCSPEYCMLAVQMAKEDGEKIPPGAWVRNEGLLFLNDRKECTLSPHLRPLCALHYCDIESLGFNMDVSAYGQQWTQDYFALRGQINKEEMQE